MSNNVQARIEEWFAAQPGSEAFELAGLTVRQHGKRNFIEILMDKKSGRITLDECGRWNRALSAHLEQADLFQGPYLVEISSPGADRPFVRPGDYVRALGRKVRVNYRDSAGTAREIVGRLERADENAVMLRSDEQALDLPYDRILRARQEIVFSKEAN